MLLETHDAFFQNYLMNRKLKVKITKAKPKQKKSIQAVLPPTTTKNIYIYNLLQFSFRGHPEKLFTNFSPK